MQSYFSFQFRACLRFTQGACRFIVATNSYFLSVSVFEFSITEGKNRLRKVIDWLEILPRMMERTWLPSLQRHPVGYKSNKEVIATVKYYGNESCICLVSPPKLLGQRILFVLSVKGSKCRIVQMVSSEVRPPGSPALPHTGWCPGASNLTAVSLPLRKGNVGITMVSHSEGHWENSMLTKQ